MTIQQLDEDYSDKSKTIGFSEENKPLNRFRNITVCKSLILPIKRHTSHDQHYMHDMTNMHINTYIT